MITGTDVSLAECKAEGYLMVKYDARRKFSHHLEVDFIRHLPEYLLNAETGGKAEPRIITMNAKDVWYDYCQHQSGIDSFVGYHWESIEDIIDVHSLLSLADAVDAYCGIFN